MIARLIRLAACVAAGLLLAVPAPAQDRPVEVQLLAPASAVVLSDETTFVVDGHAGRLTRAITIEVNAAAGRDHGRIHLFHDVFRQVRSLEGRILDGEGRVVRRLRRGDVQDRPATDGFSLYNDLRVRIAELYYDAYPYILEWRWEVDYRTLLTWPSWFPQAGPEPVRQARLRLDVPQGFPVRYRSQFFDEEPVVRQEGRRTIMEWEASAPAHTAEPLAPPFEERMPAVHFATDAFQVERHNGSLASWEEFGHWYRELSTGRDQLPEEALAEVRQLVQGVEDAYERARLVYEFLQRRTRYVSVQLGLGGWQPFDAAYVHERRYGDCKALTNYLQALLRAVGVEGFPALIGADWPDLDPDFPSNRFNHVVLFVPMGDREPVWLEATSSHLPFGHLDPGTEGRYALVVTPQGGQLHRTPKFSAETNVSGRRVQAHVQPDGAVEASVETIYTGHHVGRHRSTLNRLSGSERADWLRGAFGLSSASFEETSFDGLERGDGALIVAATLLAPGYATVAGRRVFVNPNLTRRPVAVPPEIKNRRQPVAAFRHPFVDRDTVHIHPPAGFALEVRPETVEIDAGFARYVARVEESAQGLVYVRHFEVREARLPAEQYAELREFLNAASRADEATLVFVRRE